MIVKLNNIFKVYGESGMETSVPALNDVSLTVDEGEYVAIMGPSGSGKSTLMNVIGCLDKPTSGEYFFEDKDVLRLKDRQMSDLRLHSIGFVFQSFYLMNEENAIENVALPLSYAGVKKKERERRAIEALTRVGLADRVKFRPDQLSGGQKQRVAIARAIVNNPKVLLADEPTGALDQKSGAAIMDLFQKLNEEGTTIIMITHDANIASHAKKTYRIVDGKLYSGLEEAVNEED
ncbi:MAG: ABC transporter ATP-binding protein [Pseudobutyrivibrio sp.]|uniref:ABC transporter ATP-binding protein n=1 Tax=Pseudobutyrivibrio sp. TaxID=2014367 RepID=UPI0025D6F636|nr:ABC transporter ATP-binding protein [Pseudobutyrivibrio sp.]MBQ8488342.1 ABC transporter ATP-binding protein [Pseudobutyrivibrio sp.]